MLVLPAAGRLGRVARHSAAPGPPKPPGLRSPIPPLSQADRSPRAASPVAAGCRICVQRESPPPAASINVLDPLRLGLRVPLTASLGWRVGWRLIGDGVESWLGEGPSQEWEGRGGGRHPAVSARPVTHAASSCCSYKRPRRKQRRPVAGSPEGTSWSSEGLQGRHDRKRGF